jgi:hypothetical protein
VSGALAVLVLYGICIMDRDQKNKIKEPSLLEQVLPTEMGLMKSLGESKTLIIMLVVFLTLFGGLGLFLLKMST